MADESNDLITDARTSRRSGQRLASLVAEALPLATLQELFVAKDAQASHKAFADAAMQASLGATMLPPGTAQSTLGFRQALEGLQARLKLATDSRLAIAQVSTFWYQYGRGMFANNQTNREAFLYGFIEHIEQRQPAAAQHGTGHRTPR